MLQAHQQVLAHRTAAIDGAFLRQAYDDLRHYAGRARGSLGLKAQVKCAIARLPRPLADLCAAALVRRGEAREGHPGG